MNTEPACEQLADFWVSRLAHNLLPLPIFGVLRRFELPGRALLLRLLQKVPCSFVRVLARVHKDHDLVPGHGLGFRFECLGFT